MNHIHKDILEIANPDDITQAQKAFKQTKSYDNIEAAYLAELPSCFSSIGETWEFPYYRFSLHILENDTYWILTESTLNYRAYKIGDPTEWDKLEIHLLHLQAKEQHAVNTDITADNIASKFGTDSDEWRKAWDEHSKADAAANLLLEELPYT